MHAIIQTIKMKNKIKKSKMRVQEYITYEKLDLKTDFEVVRFLGKIRETHGWVP